MASSGVYVRKRDTSTSLIFLAVVHQPQDTAPSMAMPHHSYENLHKNLEGCSSPKLRSTTNIAYPAYLSNANGHGVCSYPDSIPPSPRTHHNTTHCKEFRCKLHFNGIPYIDFSSYQQEGFFLAPALLRK